ncbi:hypothetical protein Aple_051140 [Acrocarpospora pleiomorpha]|uniref:DUF1643 domain-containing protein n=1 Tax=Acrocarpospora pleiomorpha TaxID=90975 RepID=A0A5M3XLC8_9ACTN|nr:DUF1643 domain-containing protein [Acrocarpospora pleiomorpha]GES22217.1 hypothetical protein Aple_051140 [Acrocarpospora pleiomorpha]
MRVHSDNRQPGPPARATGRGAVIDGPYRYDLWRTWTTAAHPSTCAWVMLNPSTADHTSDDPTIRRCIAYSRAWGHGALVVRNLFAFRSRNPQELLSADDPVGPDNDLWLTAHLDGVDRVVLAWGTGRYPRLAGDRWRRVAALLAPRNPVCLRTAKDGQPVHPLYQRADLNPIPWKEAA